MRANVGDWLVVKSSSDSRHSRHGEVLTVGANGAPPYTVRWTDTGSEGLLFPGPDAEIVSAAKQAEHDRHEVERLSRLQDEIAHHSGS